MKRKLLFSKLLLLCALIVGGVNCVWADEMIVNFESSFSSYEDWSYNNFEKATNAGNAHNGSGYASTASKTTGYFQTKNKIDHPTSISCYYTKLTGNTNSSSKFILQISSDGSTWTDVATGKTMNNVTQGTWEKLEADLSSYSNVYVRVYYTGTTAVRALDDVTLVYSPAVVKKNTALSLSPTSLELSYGGNSGLLTATVIPEGESALDSPAISWESSDASVATVSNGTVTPVGQGTCTITASFAGDDNYNESANTATVSVSDSRTAIVSEIASIWPIKTLYIGGNIAFVPSVTMADGISANDVVYSYVSADPTTIRINNDGTYTALKTGSNINITVTATPIQAKQSTYKPVSVSFLHNSSYKYSGLSLPATADFNGSKEITITLNNPQGPIFYTTNGNDPLEDEVNRLVYTEPFTITETTTIKARVIDAEGYYSNIQTSTYTKVPANKDEIILAANQSLSFNDFSAAGSYWSNKSDYLIASDGDKYKWTGTDVGNYQGKTLQIKNNTTSYITSSNITAPNGFKMTVTNTGSVYVYVGETKQTAATDGAYYFPSNTAVTLKRGTSSTPQVSDITFTALKPNRTITFAKDGNQEVTVDATMTNAATASPTATVTYSSSDETVATVNASGVVTGVKSGTVTITATTAEDDDYAESTASYTLTVNRAATTLAFAASEQTVELVNGTATYTATATPVDDSRVITYSSDDATVNSSTGAVSLTETGDFVIKANATATDKYLAPSEASYTLHVVDNRVPVVNAATLNLVLTDDEDNNVALNGVIKETTGTVSATYTKADGFDGTEVVSYTSSDPTVFEIDGTDFVAYKGGTVTVTVTVTSGGKKMFSTVEKEFAVTVSNPSKTATEITIMDDESNEVEDGDVLNLTYGTSITLEVSATTGYDGTIAKVLSNSSIVNVTTEGTTVTITPAAAGSTTLTISAAETANFTAADNIVLTVNVAEISAKTSAPTGFSTTTVFTDANLSYDEGMEWTSSATGLGFESTGDQRGVQFNGKGTPTVSSSISQNITRVVIVASINGSSSISSVTVGGEAFTTEDELTSGNPNTTLTYTGSGSGEIEININNSNKSLYIKSIEVGSDGPVITANIPESKFGTYCCEYPLNLPADNDDYAAYIVTAVEGTNVTFTKISGEITGGVPFILYGTPGEYNLTTAASSTYAPSGNMLVGTLSPKYITATDGDYINFGMKSGKFVRAANGVIKANKAYLPVLSSNFTSDVRTLNIIFEDGDVPTGVKSIDNGQLIIDNTVYNLKGQRVEKPVKGQLYIVNGKKVVVKKTS